MAENGLMELTALERRKYGYLSEVMDLSRQLGEALDHNDQVSVRMLVAMRQEPILHLQELEGVLRARRDSLTPEESKRVGALLKGAEPADEGERAYLHQVGIVRRLLERVLELDQRLDRRVAGSNSFYSHRS